MLYQIFNHDFWSGYLNDPEATQRTIDKEEWLFMGDIGYIHDEQLALNRKFNILLSIIGSGRKTHW